MSLNPSLNAKNFSGQRAKENAGFIPSMGPIATGNGGSDGSRPSEGKTTAKFPAISVVFPTHMTGASGNGVKIDGQAAVSPHSNLNSLFKKCWYIFTQIYTSICHVMES